MMGFHANFLRISNTITKDSNVQKISPKCGNNKSMI
jgi:hypothetical protein